MRTITTLFICLVAGVAAAQEDLAADLQGHVEELCAPRYEGRRFGTPSAAAVRTELGARLADLGVPPLGDAYEHPFTADGREGANVLGQIRGPEGSGVVILSAHFDGYAEGDAFHPAADDNASGVAIVLEAARRLAGQAPERTLVIAFFDGEEDGLRGSRAFAANPPVALSEVVCVVNLDTVGRFPDDALTIFGSDSGDRLAPALRGVNYGFGFSLQLATQGAGASDDATFREKGIPAIQLFGMAHPDYHRATDTPEKLDYATMGRVTRFVVEVMDYLARSDTRLAFVPAGAAAVAPDPARQTEGRRRVSFGSIPDFQFPGEGVRITGVMPGSAAEAAGLLAGDVIVEFGGAPVVDLTGYSEIMKQHAPGDEVDVVVQRDGETLRVTATLTARN